MLRRVLAILLLVIVAIVAIRLAVGVVVGLISAVLWRLRVRAKWRRRHTVWKARKMRRQIVLWAWSTLKSAKRGRAVKRGSSPAVTAHTEDPVEVEMRRITEQLREQGRR